MILLSLQLIESECKLESYCIYEGFLSPLFNFKECTLFRNYHMAHDVDYLSADGLVLNKD